MSSPTPQRATIHFPPTYPTLTNPSLILFGTIESSSTENWATHLSTSLLDLPIQILSPRRDDWDASWVESPAFAPFHEEVEWEMFHPAHVGLIVICFKAGSLCPVSLLELGMYAALHAGKTVVCCEEGFWKRGNVEMVCAQFGVVCVGTVGELEVVVRGRMEALSGKREEGK
ncbi:hypothetical protein P171DRAFT_430053 [Karstenula rhodostoma CBS 690.94]|uniref:Nucleoside 2-deoxyribosyltransferase n=1 Tax=Karstenula rhodostoma CBS 690.94 TaxID=1392251 RepID=A0A9P4PQM0_9PLEO|nr:hypothetical protein P171DRAFT_430053 [Karstenula rhodostoma CBS 690.94]